MNIQFFSNRQFKENENKKHNSLQKIIQEGSQKKTAACLFRRLVIPKRVFFVLFQGQKKRILFDGAIAVRLISFFFQPFPIQDKKHRNQGKKGEEIRVQSQKNKNPENHHPIGDKETCSFYFQCKRLVQRSKIFFFPRLFHIVIEIIFLHTRKDESR